MTDIGIIIFIYIFFYYFILFLLIDDEPLFYNMDLILFLITRLSINLSESVINSFTYVIFDLFYTLCQNCIYLIIIIIK